MAEFEIRASIEIDRPISDVFRLTTEHMSEWSSLAAKTVLTQDPDTRVITELQPGGFESEVIKHVPPHTSVRMTDGTRFKTRMAYMFEEIGESTRVTQVSHVIPKTTSMKILLFLTGWMTKSTSNKFAEQQLGVLKSFCESHTS